MLEVVRSVSALGEKEEFSHLNVGGRAFNLDTVGLGWVNDLILHLVLRPISNQLYKDSETQQQLDWRQGYIAGYSGSPSAKAGTPRQRLVSHTDDSEVTLNVCLGEEFEGGDLIFRGLRGTENSGKVIGEFEPQVGVAVVHAGRHLHEVTDVTKGDRFVLILWARSWSGIRKVKCPCCWLNRRTDEYCVCDWKWN